MMSLKMADVCVKDSIIYLKYCLSDILYLVLSQILLFSFCGTYWFLSHLIRLYFCLPYFLSILSSLNHHVQIGICHLDRNPSDREDLGRSSPKGVKYDCKELHFGTCVSQSKFKTQAATDANQFPTEYPTSPQPSIL